MTTKLISTIAAALSSVAVFAQDSTIHQSNAHIGLIYPLSTNGVRAAQYDNKCSMHAIAGVSHSEKAFCASGVANVVKDSVTGFIAAGAVNYIGNSTKGAQAAGFANINRNNVTGLQAAGFANVAGSIKGVQAAGFINVATKNATGVQVAGFVNTAKQATVQGAGFINVADTARAQFAGFINVAHDVKKGIQVAGFVNVAPDVAGTQIAGFVNVAKKVKGAQIAGFINIADSCDYPIGLINIMKKGEKALGLMVDETGTTFATFRSGGRILYGLVGVGFNGSHNRAIYAQQVGLGAHLPLSRHFRINGEATFTSLLGKNGSDLQTGVRILPSIRFWQLEAYAGPSFSYAHSSLPGSPFNHHPIWSDTYMYHTHELYVGMVAGIQFHF